MLQHFGQGIGKHVDDRSDYRFHGRVHRRFNQCRNNRFQRLGDHLEAVGVILSQDGRPHKSENGHDVVQHVTGE